MAEAKNVPRIRFPGFSGEWELRKLGDVTELKSASRVHRHEWTDSGVPFFRSSDVMAAINGTENEKAFISEELYEKLSSVSGKLGKGDILVTGGGSVGNPYIVPDDKPLYTKDADLLWVKNQGRFHPYFMYEYFFSPTFRDYLNSISHVGTIAHYTITQLSETPICVPEIEEQSKIGAFFADLDALIASHRQELEDVRKLKSAMLQKMFPREGEDYPEVRFPGFTDAWEMRKLGNMATIDTGKSKFTPQESGQYEILGSTSVIGYDDSYDYEGDFLLTARVGANAGDIYRHSGKVKISDNTVFIKGEELNFIYYALLHFDIKRLSFGTGQPLVKASELKEQYIMVPIEVDERTAISTCFITLDSLITLHERKIEHLGELKKGLLQQMFCGI